MKSNRNIIFVLVSVFAILIQLANSTLAYADGETEPPPPTEAATEPPPGLEKSATEVVPVEPVATEAPVAPEADVAPTDDPNASIETAATELPIVPEANAIPIDDPDASTDTTTIEDTSLLEAIQGLPAQTDVVVLDESGEVLPLATQEAADIIAMSDPMWCPAAATQVTSDCKNKATVADLINQLITSSKNEDGIIYFTSTYNTNDATFDGSNPLLLISDNRLTLQGGWDGNTTLGNPIYYSGQSVFSVPITITNWTSDITINNITVNGATSNGLTLNTTQDASINNSVFNGNVGSGMDIQNAANVAIANSTFSENGEDGAYILHANVAITDSIFSKNDENGAFIIDAHEVSIKDSRFAGNALDDTHCPAGLRVRGGDLVTISNSVFNENHVDGMWIHSTGNMNVTINNTTFEENYNGIYAQTDPGATLNLALNCVSFRNNGEDYYAGKNTTVTDNPCKPEKEKKDTRRQAVISVPVDQDVIEFVMDCSLYDSYLIQWVGGDWIVLACVEHGRARVSRVNNTALPNGLPSGFGYASAVAVEVFQNDVPLDILPTGGFIQLGFASRNENPQYGVVHWDEENGGWIRLKDFQLDTGGGSVSFSLHPSDKEDVYRVLSGARLLVDGNRYREVVTTNFTGLFVLAQH